MSKAGLLEGEYRGARVRVEIKKELVEMQASMKKVEMLRGSGT